MFGTPILPIGSAFIAHNAPVVKDVMPYMMVTGNPARVEVDLTGLSGFDSKERSQLATAYRLIFRED